MSIGRVPCGTHAVKRSRLHTLASAYGWTPYYARSARVVVALAFEASLVVYGATDGEMAGKLTCALAVEIAHFEA